jgi:hypothetical protein
MSRSFDDFNHVFDNDPNYEELNLATILMPSNLNFYLNGVPFSIMRGWLKKDSYENIWFIVTNFIQKGYPYYLNTGSGAIELSYANCGIYITDQERQTLFIQDPKFLSTHPPLNRLPASTDFRKETEEMKYKFEILETTTKEILTNVINIQSSISFQSVIDRIGILQSNIVNDLSFLKAQMLPNYLIPDINQDKDLENYWEEAFKALPKRTKDTIELVNSILKENGLPTYSDSLNKVALLKGICNKHGLEVKDL